MRFVITDYVNNLILPYIKKDGIYIDATVGRGNDILFLLKQLESGFVYGYDIQKEAIDSTSELIKKYHNYNLFQKSHALIGDDFERESIDGVIFNLGYLPKGDKKIQTSSSSTIDAIKGSLKVLKHGGFIMLTIYPNYIEIDGALICKERDDVLSFLATLDQSEYRVIKHHFINITKDSPLPVMIFKL